MAEPANARRVIHLAAPAAPVAGFIQRLDLPDADAFFDYVQRTLGPDWRVRGDASLLAAPEDDRQGGRQDDAARAADLQAALADDDVAAVLTVRGGAWFARLGRRLDLRVLERRTQPVAVLGFSELTPLVNAVARYPLAHGIYDMGPAFLPYGLRRAGVSGDGTEPTTEQLRAALDDYLRDVARMLGGRPSARPVTAQLVQGALPERSVATFVGGNLTLLMTMLAGPAGHRLEPAGHWLLIEDLNEKPERIDRWLAALGLAGWWERCAGLLLGDFHRGDESLLDAVLQLLPYHLPASRTLPVLATADVGHTYPMSPLVLNQPIELQRIGPDQYALLQPALQWDECTETRP